MSDRTVTSAHDVPSSPEISPVTVPDAAAVAAFNAGNAAWRAQQWEAALDHYEQAVAHMPQLTTAHLGRARCLVKLARWVPAREAFAAVLRLDPANYSAWLEAGHLCRQMGELQQATGAYQRAIDVAPQRHEAYLGMARTMHLLGRHDVAAQAFADTLAHVPAGPQQQRERARMALHMAQYRLEVGDVNGAAQAAQTGLQFMSTPTPTTDEDLDLCAELRIDLGEALWRLGQTGAAEQVLTAASAAVGEATLVRLALLSFRNNQWQEAVEVLRRNVALHPQSVNARWNLAHMLGECWLMDEAEQVLRQAEALGPVAGAQTLRASMAGRQGDADTALAIYRELAEKAPPDDKLRSSTAMCSLYSDRLSPQDVAKLHRELFAPLGDGARDAASFVREPLDGRRIRLGLVSADFHHQHPVNIFMQPVLRELDRSRLEVFVYFTGVSYDAQTRLAQQRVEHWVEVATFNDALLSRRIASDRIDLLLDLGGHTGQQRMPMFAKRVAPVQATYLGYPGSTGVPNMDWILGDAVVTPPELDALCSERVARLPHTVFCYAPEADYPYPTYTEQHAERPLTFGSFNNITKLTPRTLRLWSRVLDAVPGARLLLKSPSFGDAAAAAAYLRRLDTFGIDGRRVILRNASGLNDMMQEYADVDIALDPVPYNGGTTSLQALWMGVPVLCQRGGHFVSRMGASFMTAAGLPEWIAGSDEDYVAIAARMAADRPALLALKQGLRAHLLTRPGWDVVTHTRAMEQAFERMLQSSPRRPHA